LGHLRDVVDLYDGECIRSVDMVSGELARNENDVVMDSVVDDDVVQYLGFIWLRPYEIQVFIFG